jgi:hypothetical protein
MSQIPRMYRTYKSFTHKKTRSDIYSSSAKAVSFRFNLEAMCHRIRNINFLLNSEAIAMFKFHIN